VFLLSYLGGNQQLADDLNEFYFRFEKTPHTRHEPLSTQPLIPPATPLSPTPAIIPITQKNNNYRTKLLQVNGSNVCGHEVI